MADTWEKTIMAMSLKLSLKTGTTSENFSDYNYQKKITKTRGKTIQYDYDNIKVLLD